MPTRPPLLLRLLPLGLRLPVFYKFYRGRAANRYSLYDSAPLHFAPGIGMELLPTDEAHSNIAFTGIYELALTRKIMELAGPGGLFVDVGANYGYFSLLWLAANPANRVIAFEASPRNFDALHRNIQRNHFAKRAVLHAQAVGRTTGTMLFDPGSTTETGWGGLSMTPGAQTTEIPITPLDQVLPRDCEIAVLKVDVEGADAWVLEGARSLLEQQRIRHIFYEDNETRRKALGIGDDVAKNLLRDCDYEITVLNRAKGLAEFHAQPR